MTEGDRVALQAQDTSGKTFVEGGGGLRADSRDKPGLDAIRRDGHQIEETLRCWRAARDAGKHGVGDAGGSAWGVAGERFGEEEGIAAGGAIEIVPVALRLSGQSGDGGLRERRQAQPRNVTGREVAEDETQGVGLVDLVVAPGEDE